VISVLAAGCLYFFVASELEHLHGHSFTLRGPAVSPHHSFRLIGLHFGGRCD